MLSGFLISGCAARLQDKPVYQQSGLALEGYDSVAYFRQGRAVMGAKQHSTHWKNADWYFSSAENLKRFQADPEKYAPQYGGYCAYAMSYGLVVNSDPEAFHIDNGRLYLNYSKSVRAKWLKNHKQYIFEADANWQAIEEK
ncbi:hypothetical protein EOPP23_17560 [Endozoicomonas sp. OPT23]|uniref:YHS domain-containing (seleno)protein n=1 Tax=Endozoicomonas sp. OPT23 TaxID=2072845 RepID=UPI00129A4DD0|nr:YHS domain-containing (seleno)protein [Endozoicomonas sp. OPT23]MRI34791.1 hypothetical protein [Endozoicomonas sp. OPT23]